MNIDYVISSMVFWWRENHLSFEQECDYLKNLGFGIELWPTLLGSHDCRYDKRNWTRLKAGTENMTVSLNSRNDGPTINEWLEQIQCAQHLNAFCIVAKLESLCISDELGIADWGFASEVINAAKDHKVKICIETGSLNALTQVGEKYPSICYCLDTGYINLDKKNSFEEYTEKLAPRTCYLHLTDNYGVHDDNEPPGLKGGINKENWLLLKSELEKLDHKIVGCLEMFPCLPGVMIRKGCEFLFDELKWPGKPATEKKYSSYRPL
jgi:sugar phosphate isomerase/epimerase